MNSAVIVDRQTSFEDLPELLTTAEVRAFLGFSKTTIYQLIKSKEISSQRIGGRIFVPKKVLMPETPEAVGARIQKTNPLSIPARALLTSCKGNLERFALKIQMGVSGRS